MLLPKTSTSWLLLLLCCIHHLQPADQGCAQSLAPRMRMPFNRAPLSSAAIATNG